MRHLLDYSERPVLSVNIIVQYIFIYNYLYFIIFLILLKIVMSLNFWSRFACCYCVSIVEKSQKSTAFFLGIITIANIAGRSLLLLSCNNSMDEYLNCYIQYGKNQSRIISSPLFRHRHNEQFHSQWVALHRKFIKYEVHSMTHTYNPLQMKLENVSDTGCLREVFDTSSITSVRLSDKRSIAPISGLYLLCIQFSAFTDV